MVGMAVVFSFNVSYLASASRMCNGSEAALDGSELAAVADSAASLISFSSKASNEWKRKKHKTQKT